MAEHNPLGDLTFLGRNSRLVRYFGRPLQQFLAVEAAGGVLMLAAAAAALVWANSPWQDTYRAFWASEVSFTAAGYHFDEDLRSVVKDGLMALFFFVVGLEIKRELVTGQLRDLRFAALPAVAAVGGMAGPAAVYLALNAGGPHQEGWGIPVATDIAFAIGVLSLLGDRVPRQMKVFLLSLAIVDDIAAVVMIAVFYTKGISGGWLLVAGAIVAAILLLRRLHVWYLPVYIAAGVALWVAVLESGIHTSIAGVALGLLTPATPLQSKQQARQWAKWLHDRKDVRVSDLRRASFHIRESLPVGQRIEERLHPITSYVVIPVFALSASGVELSRQTLADAATSTVTLGVAIGLAAGNTAGITLFCWAADRIGLVRIPKALAGMRLVGLAMVAGIGFTVSLFVSALAFEDPLVQDQAKIGILAGSLAAALGGVAILLLASLRGRAVGQARRPPAPAAEDRH